MRKARRILSPAVSEKPFEAELAPVLKPIRSTGPKAAVFFRVSEVPGTVADKQIEANPEWPEVERRAGIYVSGLHHAKAEDSRWEHRVKLRLGRQLLDGSIERDGHPALFCCALPLIFEGASIFST